MSNEWDSDNPEVIRAKAESREKELLARAKLTPIAQVASTLVEEVGSCLAGLGCLFIILVAVIGLFSKNIIDIIGAMK